MFVVSVISTLQKTICYYLAKMNISIHYGPTVSLLTVYIYSTYVYQKVRTRIFLAAVFVIALCWRLPGPLLGSMNHLQALTRTELCSSGQFVIAKGYKAKLAQEKFHGANRVQRKPGVSF